METTPSRPPVSAAISLVMTFVALNLVMGSLVSFLRLPIYLDSVGLLLSTILLGWRWGLLCALATCMVGFFLINPYLPAYVGTAVAIIVTTEMLFRGGMFGSLFGAIVGGLVVAVVAAVLSAPVTAYLFSGITLSGNDALTAYFLATGKSMLDSVLLSGFSSEPVDKVLVSVATYFVLRALPEVTMARIGLRLPKR